MPAQLKPAWLRQHAPCQRARAMHVVACSPTAGASQIPSLPFPCKTYKKLHRYKVASRDVRASAVDESLRLRTPHSGYHDDGTGRRFFEGWYFKVATEFHEHTVFNEHICNIVDILRYVYCYSRIEVTLPDVKDSFALMYSIEKGDKSTNRVGAQVMGPDDGYIAQANTDLSTFWAARDSLSLGACFRPAAARQFGDVPKKAVDEVTFDDIIEQGFQATDTWHQGCIIDAPGTAPGDMPAAVPRARWAFRIRPIYGWGDAGAAQRSTAGWLSSLPVFEPHWQVLMAHGVADGWFEWGEKRYNFKNCPAYAEKNWGAGFPKKWGWLQCNSFPEYPNLSITAVGAIRNLLNVPGIEEEVGMLGIHYQGKFIELAPWSGPNADVRWSVEPWGEWRMWARNGKYEALIECRCDKDTGAVLRAPTALEGLAPACKDTFYGVARLRIWTLDASGIRKGEALVDAMSETCTAEVGGGPWWHNWKKRAQLNSAVRLAVSIPVDQSLSRLEAVAESAGVKMKVPSQLLPPGL